MLFFESLVMNELSHLFALQVRLYVIADVVAALVVTAVMLAHVLTTATVNDNISLCADFRKNNCGRSKPSIE